MNNPFRGLLAYSRKERELLFGRDDDLTLILARLFSRRTTLLFAGSGVGKTSFLNARVIPEIEDRYFVAYHNAWPSSAPLQGLRESVGRELRQGPWRNAGNLTDRLFPEFIRSLRPTRAGDDGEPVEADGIVLVLDQFEEVFQHHKETDDFHLFVAQISELILDLRCELRVVLSMREEFLGELSAFDNKVPDLFANYYRLKSPTRRQAIDIIGETSRSAGIPPSRFVAPLVDDLLAAKPSGSRSTTHRSRDFVPPPYLQIACQRLWDEKIPTPETGFPVHYMEGGAADALKQYCHSHLDQLDQPQRHYVSRALGFLITRQGAKMAYELSSLSEHMQSPQEEIRSALDRLARPEVRILRSITTANGETWYELYHDMYAPTLSAWKDEFERIQQEEQRKSRELAEARRRRANWVAVSVVALATIIGAAGYIFFSGRTNVLAQKVEAQALLAAAREQLPVDAQRSILLTLAALRNQTGFEPGTAEQILTAAVRTPVPQPAESIGTPLTVEPGLDKDPVAYNYVTTASVTGRPDGTLLWRNGSTTTSIKVADSPFTSLSFNSLGTVLMAGLESGSALWINAATKKVSAICPGSPGDAAHVGYRGSLPTTTTVKGVTRAWERSTLLPSVPISDQSVLTVAYSPSGQQIVTGGVNTLVSLLNAPSLARIGNDRENKPVRSGPIQQVAWSPDGKSVAAVSRDGLLNLWEAANGRNFASFSYKRSFWSVDWNPDGKSVAVSSSEGAVYLVPLFPYQQPIAGVRHKGRVLSVRYAPSGDFFASGGMDEQLLFTRLKGASAPRSISNASVITDIAFGPAPLLAYATAYGLTYVYDYHKAVRLTTLIEHSGQVNAVAFHPSGTLVATGGQDGTVRIWNVADGRELLRYAEHSGAVTDVSFSPDGKRLASSGADGFVRLWATSAEDLLEIAKKYLTRELTEEECSQFLRRSNGCGEYATSKHN